MYFDKAKERPSTTDLVMIEMFRIISFPGDFYLEISKISGVMGITFNSINFFTFEGDETKLSEIIITFSHSPSFFIKRNIFIFYTKWMAISIIVNAIS